MIDFTNPYTIAGLLSSVVGLSIVLGIIKSAMKQVRPTEKGLVERFGKYRRFVAGGLTFLVPFIDRIVKVNITEQMSPVQRQDVITKDKVFMGVDAVVFYKIKADELSVKASQYSVANYVTQIDTLGRTVLRDIIGGMDMAEANVSRGKINTTLREALDEQTENWGIQIVRAEIKDLEPPKELITSMESVLKADNDRQAAEKTALATAKLAEGQANAAIQTATGSRQAAILSAEGNKQAAITLAEGNRQAAILNAEGAQQATVLRAEGDRQAAIKVAEGQAQATELTQVALQKYFTDNAQKFKELETVRDSLQSNTKLVVPSGQAMTLILDERNNLKDTITPIAKKSGA